MHVSHEEPHLHLALVRAKEGLRCFRLFVSLFFANAADNHSIHWSLDVDDRR